MDATARKVVRITREEVHPRQMPGLPFVHQYVYKVENVNKPLRSLKLAKREALLKFPGALLVCDWKGGAA